MQRADGQPEVRRQGSSMTKEDQEAVLVNKITTTGTNVLFFILLTHVGDVRGKRVAETGCGNGRGTLLLSQAVGDKGIVLASDVVPLMVVKAREEIQRAGVRNVVVDTAEPERMVQEAFRILKPGGVFALSCAKPARDSNCFMKAMTEAIGHAMGHEKAAEADSWLAKTNEQGSIPNVSRLLVERGFLDIFGWEQDVALSVNTIAEATVVVKSNAFTRNMVPLHKRKGLDQPVNAWAYSLFSSQRQPMFGSNCFKARKPTVYAPETD